MSRHHPSAGSESHNIVIPSARTYLLWAIHEMFSNIQARIIFIFIFFEATDFTRTCVSAMTDVHAFASYRSVCILIVPDFVISSFFR